MTLQEIFNAFLLTLSLATILLTLASFFIYKLRQLPPKAAADPDAMRIEGVFFRRYFPADALPAPAPAPVPSPVGAALRKPLSLLNKSAFVFFGLMCAVIFVALGAQGYFSGLFASRGRARTAAQQRTLSEQGLLREYDFAEMDTSRLLAETILPSQLKAVDALAKRVASRRVALVELASSSRHNGPRISASVGTWAEFLREQRIPFEKLQELPQPGAHDLVIIPQAKALNEAARAAIDRLLDGGVSVAATGPIGVWNGLGHETADHAWTEKRFGVRIVANEEAEGFFPSLLSARHALGFDTPPGLLLRDFPQDNSYKALARTGMTPAFEASYRGALHQHQGTPVARVQAVDVAGHGRALWIASDPRADGEKRKASFTDAESFYSRAFALGLLAWSARVPTVVPAPWKDGKPVAMVMSVDTEDEFGNARRLAAAFKDTGFPATFFVVSRLYRTNAAALDKAGDDAEIASHSEDHSSFDKQEPGEQFDRIQDARLETEEISSREILGFRPPTEKFDEHTIAATIQNRLRYFYGDGRHYRYAPVWIASGKLLFIPRVANDDISVQKRREGSDPEGAMAIFRSDAEQAERVGGSYLLALHTQAVGASRFDKPLRALLGDLATKDAWRTQFRGLYEWWKARSLLETEIVAHGSRRFTIRLKNTSDLPLEGLWLVADLGAPIVSVEKPELARVENEGRGLAISRLGPGAQAEIELRLQR